MDENRFFNFNRTILWQEDRTKEESGVYVYPWIPTWHIPEERTIAEP